MHSLLQRLLLACDENLVATLFAFLTITLIDCICILVRFLNLFFCRPTLSKNSNYAMLTLHFLFSSSLFHS